MANQNESKERRSLPQACTLPQEERERRAAELDAAADRLMEHATDPTVLAPYTNEEGERCPSPISAVGSLRQAAEKLRRGLPTSPILLQK